MDDGDCPLCLEELDLADRQFKPCVCGYQICRFCYHYIREQMSGLCPACRRAYSDEMISFTPLTAEQLAQMKKEAKKKGKQGKSDKEQEAEREAIAAAAATTQAQLAAIASQRPMPTLGRTSSSGAAPPSAASSVQAPPTTAAGGRGGPEVAVAAAGRNLSGQRVVQRNVVYVIGIPLQIASDEVLRSPNYFGRFGKVLRVVVNKRPVFTSTQSGSAPAGGPTASAYIVFSSREAAAAAIAAVDGTWLDGNIMRASFATTKALGPGIPGVEVGTTGVGTGFGDDEASAGSALPATASWAKSGTSTTAPSAAAGAQSRASTRPQKLFARGGAGSGPAGGITTASMPPTGASRNRGSGGSGGEKAPGERSRRSSKAKAAAAAAAAVGGSTGPGPGPATGKGAAAVARAASTGASGTLKAKSSSSTSASKRRSTSSTGALGSQPASAAAKRGKPYRHGGDSSDEFDDADAGVDEDTDAATKASTDRATSSSAPTAAGPKMTTAKSRREAKKAEKAEKESLRQQLTREAIVIPLTRDRHVRDTTAVGAGPTGRTGHEDDDEEDDEDDDGEEGEDDEEGDGDGDGDAEEDDEDEDDGDGDGDDDKSEGADETPDDVSHEGGDESDWDGEVDDAHVDIDEDEGDAVAAAMAVAMAPPVGIPRPPLSPGVIGGRRRSSSITDGGDTEPPLARATRAEMEPQGPAALLTSDEETAAVPSRLMGLPSIPVDASSPAISSNHAVNRDGWSWASTAPPLVPVRPAVPPGFSTPWSPPSAAGRAQAPGSTWAPPGLARPPAAAAAPVATQASTAASYGPAASPTQSPTIGRRPGLGLGAVVLEDGEGDDDEGDSSAVPALLGSRAFGAVRPAVAANLFGMFAQASTAPGTTGLGRASTLGAGAPWTTAKPETLSGVRGSAPPGPPAVLALHQTGEHHMSAAEASSLALRLDESKTLSPFHSAFTRTGDDGDTPDSEPERARRAGGKPAARPFAAATVPAATAARANGARGVVTPQVVRPRAYSAAFDAGSTRSRVAVVTLEPFEEDDEDDEDGAGDFSYVLTALANAAARLPPPAAPAARSAAPAAPSELSLSRLTDVARTSRPSPSRHRSAWPQRCKAAAVLTRPGGGRGPRARAPHNAPTTELFPLAQPARLPDPSTTSAAATVAAAAAPVAPTPSGRGGRGRAVPSTQAEPSAGRGAKSSPGLSVRPQATSVRPVAAPEASAQWRRVPLPVDPLAAGPASAAPPAPATAPAPTATSSSSAAAAGTVRPAPAAAVAKGPMANATATASAPAAAPPPPPPSAARPPPPVAPAAASVAAAAATARPTAAAATAAATRPVAAPSAVPKPATTAPVAIPAANVAGGRRTTGATSSASDDVVDSWEQLEAESPPQDGVLRRSEKPSLLSRMFGAAADVSAPPAATATAPASTAKGDTKAGSKVAQGAASAASAKPSPKAASGSTGTATAAPAPAAAVAATPAVPAAAAGATSKKGKKGDDKEAPANPAASAAAAAPPAAAAPGAGAGASTPAATAAAKPSDKGSAKAPSVDPSAAGPGAVPAQDAADPPVAAAPEASKSAKDKGAKAAGGKGTGSTAAAAAAPASAPAAPPATLAAPPSTSAVPAVSSKKAKKAAAAAAATGTSAPSATPPPPSSSSSAANAAAAAATAASTAEFAANWLMPDTPIVPSPNAPSPYGGLSTSALTSLMAIRQDGLRNVLNPEIFEIDAETGEVSYRNEWVVSHLEHELVDAKRDVQLLEARLTALVRQNRGTVF